MSRKELKPNDLGFDEDWVGNNIALKCPICKKNIYC
ncbi:MAG: hypothetical protein CI953_904 [Methanohalophilus sp.]|nr:MAG: hypothetical protein CI953_904 [Methanohalophilus sp.]